MSGVTRHPRRQQPPRQRPQGRVQVLRRGPQGPSHEARARLPHSPLQPLPRRCLFNPLLPSVESPGINSSSYGSSIYYLLVMRCRIYLRIMYVCKTSVVMFSC